MSTLSDSFQNKDHNSVEFILFSSNQPLSCLKISLTGSNQCYNEKGIQNFNLYYNRCSPQNNCPRDSFNMLCYLSSYSDQLLQTSKKGIYIYRDAKYMDKNIL